MSRASSRASTYYALCRRRRDIGGEIWVDLQSKLTHVGPTGFVGDVSAQFDPFASIASCETWPQ